MYGKTPSYDKMIKDYRSKKIYVESNGATFPDKSPELFEGTVKVHGTFAGVRLYHDGKHTCHSKNRTLHKPDAHYGFKNFISGNLSLLSYMRQLVSTLRPGQCLEILGEWAGPGIQSKVGVNQLDSKKWFIFGIRVKDEGDKKGLTTEYFPAELLKKFRFSDFTNVLGLWENTDFIYRVFVDFSSPLASLDKIKSLVDKVEKQCPVANHYGVNGTGEGIVFWSQDKILDQFLKFKAKGEKHAVSRVKRLDPKKFVKYEKALNFASDTVTDNRIKQAIEEVSRNLEIRPEDLSKEHTGPVLRWVTEDIREEDSDVLEQVGLEWKDVKSVVSAQAAKKFFKIASILTV